MKILLPFLVFLSLTPSISQAEPAAASAAVAADHTAAWRAFLLEQRATRIADLHAYTAASVFPTNDAQPGMLNIFMDDSGRRCAMADLLWQDGEQALVRETARTHNDIRLGEVTDGPLLDWMLTSGLTQEEVAFVQEPDSFISPALASDRRAQAVAAEHQRLQGHFLTALFQLETSHDQSIEIALARLGDRLNQSPPSGR